MEKLWTATEAAKCLRIAEGDVEQLVRQGRLTAYRLGGKFLRFRPDEVKALHGVIPPRDSDFPAAPATPRRPWQQRLRDALYFYDFYIFSSALLICLIVYLIASS